MPLAGSAYVAVNGRVVRARIVNISRGGVLLEFGGISFSSLPTVGDRAAMAFDLPRHPLFSPRSLTCKGVIIRAMGEPDRPPHIAIQFTEVKIRPRAAILCLCRKSPRTSEASGSGIHLVAKAKQSNHEDGALTRPRMQHLGA